VSRLTPQPWKKLKRVFELAGFKEERTSGDHICMVKVGVARPIVIPKYAAVGLDIILANIRTAGLSRRDFLKLLEKA
jgi:predicted RNA binding protein YcfA (HicA-like mRNA interferase family)